MPDDSSTTAHSDRHGTSVDEAVALYEAVYSSQDISIGSPASEGFRYRYRTVSDERVAVATSAVEARRWGTIDPAGQYILAWSDRPGIVVDTDSRHPVEMAVGVPVVWPAGRPFAFDAPPATQHLVRFDGGFLEGIAAVQRQDEPVPLRLDRVATREQLGTLRAAIRGAAAVLFSPSAAPAVRALHATRVAEAVVAAFDATPTERTALPSGPRVRTSASTAQDWIVANAHRAVTMTDIARATGLSARGLQSAFQREVGTSPMRFLRRVRLERVRRELLRSDAGEHSVAEVAGAWGFGHLGRFSSYYAELFGEYPSATLRAARPDWTPAG